MLTLEYKRWEGAPEPKPLDQVIDRIRVLLGAGASCTSSAGGGGAAPARDSSHATSSSRRTSRSFPSLITRKGRAFAIALARRRAG